MFSRNTSPFAYVLLLILGIETGVTFLGNGFIVAVNGCRWFQSRKMLPSDLILTTLSTTRILKQLVSIAIQLVHLGTSESFCNNYLWTTLFYVWTYSNTTTIWCATWLSFFYCVKITSFAHPLLLWLKSRIDMLVPRLLGLSLTILSLPIVLSCLKIKTFCSPKGNITGNSQDIDSKNYKDGLFFSLHFIFIAINVSICLTASILLLISLRRHTRNLKKSGFATKDLNTQAHISVVYSLSSFLFFYILYAIVVTLYLNYYLRLGTVESLVINVLLGLSPSAHSIILILTNPKLKDVCIQVLKIR